ncbi:MAG: fibronectin type III domain-containing protein [Bacteroidetes bacterium]|nr:fibronectin type III domain-containing protein [Bacteroidota bacterium]
MKKQIIKITRNALAALLVLFTAGTTMAQVHSLQLSMQNVTNQNPNTVEFELWIKDLSPDSTSLLSFLQFGIDLPAGIGNGGTLSCSKIAFNPLLPSSQQAVGAPAVQGQPSAPTIRVASQTTTPGLAAAIPNTGNGIWYATYRITNTQNFAQNAVMTFTPVANQAGAKTRTIVAAYVNGSSNGVSYTVAGSTPAQSALRVLNILPYPSITLNQPVGTCPTAGNANVTDPICFGGLGSADITLSPVPVPVSGSYSVDGGTAASYTTNPFTISGLSQGSHTVTVTNDPNCAPFDVVFTVGGPSSNPTNTTTQSACDSYTWSVTGMSYTQTGTYTGTSVNSQGCTVDEILDLTITPSTSNTTVASACDSYTWSVDNMMYTQSGTYTSVNGCHTEILDLTITPTTTNTTVASGCDSYTWTVNGMMYTMSGTYSEVSPNNPCHTEILDLTITPTTTNTTVASGCDSYTWSVNNMMYTQSGTYSEVSTTNPCHTEILELTITPSTSNTTVASACDSYTWSVNGMMYTMSGTYSQASTTNPCHTEILDLTITPTTTNTTVASACDSYTWSVNGMMYTMSGTYSEVSPNNPCHTEILDLTITPSTSNTTVASACDSYTWSVDNMMYTMSGTYTSVNGCHTEILDLTITPSTSNTTVASACDSYTWSVNGMMYTMSGTYSQASTTNPCHTEILDLTITPSTTNTTVASGCDSYTWSVNGMMYTMSGTYSEVSPNNPCHTEILELTITPSTSNTTVATGCDSYTWSVNNMMYTMSGTYTSVNGCHTEILDLTLGQSTSSTITANAPVSYTWACDNVTYTQSGTYTCTGVNSTGCPDVQTLILTIGGCNLNVTTANASGCPGAPIMLTGSPAGGTWSVANPYIGPSTTFTYTYTDPNTGCTGTATGTITVANLAAVTITSVNVTGPTTATVNWTPVAGLGWYEVRYRPIGSGSWTGGGTQAAPASSKNLVGLIAGTTYEVEVRGFCSMNNPGPWGSNTVFTTAGACGTPSGLFAAPVTGTTAKLNWTAVPGASYYQVRYRVAGNTSWLAAGTQAAPATSKNIIGLTLNTQYEWQVRAVCNNAAGAWSTIDMFTTLASKQSVDFATETINNNVSVYPNPVRDVLTVEVTTEVAQNTVVKVFDMSGRLVKQIQANAEIGVNNIAVNLSDVSAGVYQVQVFANDKLTHISKVSKQD